MKQDQASSTALLIARSTLFMGSHPKFRHLVPPGASELCKRFVLDHARFPRLQLFLFQQPLYRRWVQWIERKTLAGIQLHYLLRKRKIESLVRLCLREGFHRVNVLGAGFDTLAWRLAVEYPAVEFTEFDHPSTQRAKLRTLQGLEAKPGNLDFQALDLTLPHGLASGNVSRRGAEDLVVIIEGVLMYLPESDVKRLLKRLRDNATGRLRLVFTFMNPDPAGRLRFHNASPRVERWLARRREPFLWGAAPGQLEQMLEATGYRLVMHLGHEELGAEYLEPEGHDSLAMGERIAVAVPVGSHESNPPPDGS